MDPPAGNKDEQACTDAMTSDLSLSWGPGSTGKLIVSLHKMYDRVAFVCGCRHGLMMEWRPGESPGTRGLALLEPRTLQLLLCERLSYVFVGAGVI
jgi:hypothetical protein